MSALRVQPLASECADRRGTSHCAVRGPGAHSACARALTRGGCLPLSLRPPPPWEVLIPSVRSLSGNEPPLGANRGPSKRASCLRAVTAALEPGVLAVSSAPVRFRPPRLSSELCIQEFVLSKPRHVLQLLRSCFRRGPCVARPVRGAVGGGAGWGGVGGGPALTRANTC